MRVYLDYNATAPLRPEAKAAMSAALDAAGNAQSVHAEGRQARARIEAARRQVLREGKGRALVSVMAANNETGVVQPIADVVSEAKASGALVHCDAVQAAGKIPFSFAKLGLDYATLSAHKLGGPQGAGALL